MKVGDYVRTKDGHIDKIVKISDEMKSGRTIKVQDGEIDNISGYEDFVDWFSQGHFIKSSPNIIDLIQTGDYVNGMYVEDVRETFLNVATGSDYFQSPTIYEKDIKSIVTKEQFESMEYKVER